MQDEGIRAKKLPLNISGFCALVMLGLTIERIEFGFVSG